MKANKEMRIFLLISYGVPILLSIFMWIAHQNNLNCNAFPITWMFLPAAAVMVAKKCNETPDHIFPKTFYWTYIVTTFLMVVFSIASAVIDSSVWAIIINVLAIVCGVVCIIEMIAMGKEKRSMAGLSFGNDLKKTGFGILLFVILYAVIFALNTILSACIRGKGWSEYVHSQINYFNPLGVILLIINLPLSYLAFFGEEYGWRYFFQPALQKKYGLRKGVILLGVLWGLWHIPLNFLYYSPKTGVFQFHDPSHPLCWHWCFYGMALYENRQYLVCCNRSLFAKQHRRNLFWCIASKCCSGFQGRFDSTDCVYVGISSVLEHKRI